MVSLDFIANDSSDANPVLQAYDSLNNVVDTATVGGVYTAGQIVTLTVSGSNIAYIYALGDPTIPIPTAGGSDSWTLDNLQIQFIPAPGAILLGGIGVSLVGWLRGRRTL